MRADSDQSASELLARVYLLILTWSKPSSQDLELEIDAVKHFSEMNNSQKHPEDSTIVLMQGDL
jgi:hypothetical protein